MKKIRKPFGSVVQDVICDEKFYSLKEVAKRANKGFFHHFERKDHCAGETVHAIIQKIREAILTTMAEERNAEAGSAAAMDNTPFLKRNKVGLAAGSKTATLLCHYERCKDS